MPCGQPQAPRGSSQHHALILHIFCQSRAPLALTGQGKNEVLIGGQGCDSLIAGTGAAMLSAAVGAAS
jgi:hypothetical protein